MSLTPSWVAIRWLLLGWVTLCGQVNHLGIYPTTKVNSAFHHSGVSKSSTCLSGWVKVGCIHLCDPMWQVTLCSSEMGFPHLLTRAVNYYP